MPVAGAGGKREDMVVYGRYCAGTDHRQGKAFVNEGFFDRFIGKRTVIRGSVKRCLIGCIDAVRMGSACIGHIYLRMCLQEILLFVVLQRGKHRAVVHPVTVHDGVKAAEIGRAGRSICSSACAYGSADGAGLGSVCVSCGGGVYSWSGRDRVVLEGGNIVNNTAHRQGGGVYVSHAPWSITIKNALITANTAAIQGGGIWSCPKGTVSLGTDAAVFGNTAGKSADDAAFLLKWNETYSTSFSGKMYGGGLVTWYSDTSIGAGDANYGAFGGDRYDAANPGAPVEPASGAITGYGLKAVVSAESKALAETAPLKIMGNTAERGGGVGTNGEVLIPGEDTLENPVSLTVHKVWSGASAYPTAVTVNLIRIAKDGTRTAIGTVLLSERSTDKDGKTWSYTFANLDGAYTYTVEEEAVDGFNTSISGSMADGFTITNSKKSGGGGGGGGHHKPDPKPTPNPDPKPPVDIPDQPTPLDPLKPTENIPNNKVPTTKPETQTKTPDKTKAVNIPDSKTPTSSVPKTGDIGGLWAALCGLSAMGLAHFGIRRKHD